MKRIITLLSALALLLALFAISASAEEQAVYAYVTISVKGSLVAVQTRVALNDYDDDGALTVCDALYAAHEQLYDGGAETGFGYYTGDYGLSMSKLWGDESGAYGYYLNNASCTSLADPVKNGDYVTAFVYASSDWSDVYTYFDVSAQTLELGQEITLTLMAAGYDENWNPITYPVAGATIIVDGARTGIVTDANGQATFKQNVIGTAVISATSTEQTLVPPACKLTVVASEQEATTDAAKASGCKAIAGSALVLVSLGAVAMIKRKEK